MNDFIDKTNSGGRCSAFNFGPVLCDLAHVGECSNLNHCRKGQQLDIAV